MSQMVLHNTAKAYNRYLSPLCTTSPLPAKTIPCNSCPRRQYVTLSVKLLTLTQMSCSTEPAAGIYRDVFIYYLTDSIHFPPKASEITHQEWKFILRTVKVLAFAGKSAISPVSTLTMCSSGCQNVKSCFARTERWTKSWLPNFSE